MYSMLALNSCSSCLNLPNAGIISTHQYTLDLISFFPLKDYLKLSPQGPGHYWGQSSSCIHVFFISKRCSTWAPTKVLKILEAVFYVPFTKEFKKHKDKRLYYLSTSTFLSSFRRSIWLLPGVLIK
jgi:hypothetical protein